MDRIRVGFFSFTEITDPGAHRAYNEWHMLDHMPEQLPLPGVAWGQRWVLTPADAARATTSAPLTDVHYVTLYLMGDPVTTTLDAFAALGAELHATPGRWFEPRRAHVSGPWAVADARMAATVPIRAEALPARPHRAVHVQVGGAVDLEARAERSGVLGAWRFVGGDDELAARRRGRVHDDVVVTWLDDVAADVGPVTGARFAATLRPITPWEWDWFEPAPGRTAD